MRFSYHVVVLDIGEDSDGRLVFAGDKLVAVLSRLGDLHGDQAGRWFVETAFASPLPMMRETFATFDEFESRFGEHGHQSSVGSGPDPHQG